MPAQMSKASGKIIVIGSEQTQPRPRVDTTSRILRGPRRPYVPGVREPINLPSQTIALPPIERPPGAPPTFNWITSLLPPILLIVGMLVVSRLMKLPSGMVYMSMIMSVGFPIANLIGLNVQKRAYKKAVEQREGNYKHALDQERNRLLALAQDQRSKMESIAPRAKILLDVALARGLKPRLWWRRIQDRDFLSLRIGLSKGPPSFSIALPNMGDPFDPLTELPKALIHEFEEIPDLPFTINLRKCGSLGVCGNHVEAQYGAIYRLVLDLLINHSPQDVQLFLLCDREDWAEHWDWLKWVPHTQVLKANNNDKIQRIAPRMGTVSDTLEWLVSQYKVRREPRFGQISEVRKSALVVIVDDTGRIRQMPNLLSMVQNGQEVDIFLMFVGERYLPQVRARLDVSDRKAFRYVETWDGGESRRGQAELINSNDMELAARAMSMLELMSDHSTIALPESVRLFDVVDAVAPTIELIKQNWSLPRSDRELLQFPIGLRTSRTGLEETQINLLPAERGGIDAYHTILIGTTGSGKSEFMKSLVMGAAYRYSPRLLNFFFLDFKGGAAFSIFDGLPHVTGSVTNLRPELVERGLDAISSEIERRQEKFAQVGVINIWNYNNQRSSQPMPHLVLLLDEFAKGLVDFPRLQEILDLLVRQGRSLGMYLILANQNVSSAVDRLLDNVGWRIALKVARDEEMHIIEKSLPRALRAGHGYLRSLNGDIFEFQAGYGGLTIQSQATAASEEFKIFNVESDGAFRLIYTHSAGQDGVVDTDQPALKEEEFLLSIIRQATSQLNIDSARPIYLAPLPAEITLHEAVLAAEPYRVFAQDGWGTVIDLQRRLSAPVGFIDLPKDCLQAPFEISFDEKDGHLWIVGSPGSGKTQSLQTILTALAITHTPEDLNFYILEYGSGSLKRFEALPHTGAVLRLGEQERLERLLNYLDQEMDQRTGSGFPTSDDNAAAQRGATTAAADIFLIINNFAELVTTYPDLAEKISRYVQNGKSAGLHLIITTNRGAELPRRISNNLARRIVLQMATREEYMDITQKMVQPLGTRAPGRGYYVDDGIVECQIAQAEPLTLTGSVDHGNINIVDLGELMSQAWRNEPHPRQIGVIPTQISFSKAVEQHAMRPGGGIPIGIAYATLEPFRIELTDTVPQWLVIGPKQKGKSSFLAAIARSVLWSGASSWDVTAYSLRRSPPLYALASYNPGLQVISTLDRIEEHCRNLITHLTTDPEDLPREVRKTLLLIDDLDAAFEPSKEKEPVRAALEALAPIIRDRNDVYLVASGLLDNLRNHTGSGIIRLLRQSNTGMAFSVDPMVLEWLGVPMQALMPYKKLDFPAGRGFFVHKKPVLVQAFMAE